MPEPSELPAVSQELRAKIEASPPEVREFIAALNQENKRANKMNAKLEATIANMTNKQPGSHDTAALMSDDELEVTIQPLLMEVVREAGGWEGYCSKHGIDPETVLMDTDPR